MRSVRARIVAFTAALLSVFSQSCGPSKSPPASAAAHSAQSLAAKTIQVQELEERPPLTSVQRLGDPQAAAAVALVHDAGAQASIALAELLAERLKRAGVKEVHVRASTLGVQAFALVTDAAGAAKFVRAASAAISTPVTSSEPALRALTGKLSALDKRRFSTRAQAAAAECVGELGTPPKERAESVNGARVETWRRLIHDERAASFAVVGPESVSNEAVTALLAIPPWPNRAAPSDPWPQANAADWAPGADGPGTLALAVRVEDGGAAVAAARALGSSGGVLAERLRVLPGAWFVDRVTAVTRPRGGCLRVDLSSATLRGSVPLSVPARAALVSLDEVERTLARATAPGWALQQAVLDAADPREAAAIAAWQALSGRLDAGERRHFTHFSGRIDEKAAEPVSFERALSAVARRWQRPSMEQRTRVERGQGRLWMLLASPCGTSGESSADAGVSALLMRTLASTRARLGQVAIEPWASTDGIGLLAHASPLGPRESSIAHAERVADALGRAVFSRLGDADVAAARAELLRDLGSKPRAGFAALLEGLAPGHPSWLEPRGSWEAVSELTPQGVAARRQLFWRGPLRVAIVSNADKAQSAAAAAALDRWFRPLRGEPSGCPQDSAAIPQSGQMSVATTGGSEASVVYVAVPIPADAGSRAAGRATAYLLNRRGGWLDRALGGPKLASSARASVFGGSRAGALVIEVRAVEGKTSDAAAQVRALLKRLSEGAATVEDAARAAEWLARVEQAAVLDPRRRIVELWTGAAEAPPPSLKELRQLHRGFGAEAHLVVQVEAK